VSTLTIKDLHATVADFEILRGVDLELRSGEVHALMGPNGSGKSTLSHVLMGRDDYTVTDGSVTIDGEQVDNPDDYKGEPIPGGPTDPDAPAAPGEDKERAEKD
jgi:Fe-S cluster assembly ATP-binding protein